MCRDVYEIQKLIKIMEIGTTLDMGKVETGDGKFLRKERKSDL